MSMWQGIQRDIVLLFTININHLSKRVNLWHRIPKPYLSNMTKYIFMQIAKHFRKARRIHLSLSLNSGQYFSFRKGLYIYIRSLFKKYVEYLTCAARVGFRKIRLVSLGSYRSATFSDHRYLHLLITYTVLSKECFFRLSDYKMYCLKEQRQRANRRLTLRELA